MDLDSSLVTVRLNMSSPIVLNVSPIWVILCIVFSPLGTLVAQTFQKCTWSCFIPHIEQLVALLLSSPVYWLWSLLSPGTQLYVLQYPLGDPICQNILCVFLSQLQVAWHDSGHESLWISLAEYCKVFCWNSVMMYDYMLQQIGQEEWSYKVQFWAVSLTVLVYMRYLML